MTFTDWAVEPARARFTVAPAPAVALQDFAAALEASPRFSNVAPQIDPAQGRTFFLVDVAALPRDRQAARAAAD